MISKQLCEIFLSGKDKLTDIKGQDKIKKDLISALISNRHVVIIGPPGIGKTTLAKNISKLLPETEVVEDCEYHCNPKSPMCPTCLSKKDLKGVKISGEDRFIRIQGSPDLTVEDLLGDIDLIKAMKYGPLSMEAFTPGKIFKANNGILFFDELNRCPEKLQNALLQVLEEGKATIGSYDVDITANFIFIGTMNPEDSSTEKLSDVFLDRFDLVYMGYPETLEIEKEIVLLKGTKQDIIYPEKLLNFTIHFVRLLREDPDIVKKPSVRASLGMYERSQSIALLDGKKEVTLSDVKSAVISVLAHRIELKPSVKYLKSPLEYIEDTFKKFEQDFEDLHYKESDCL